MLRHQDPAYWNGLIKMALTKLFMLRALLDGPAHGYDVARRTTALSVGTCSPTPGTIYPVLREWEESGLVQGSDELFQGRRRRVYQLTEEGRAACMTAMRVWEKAGRAVLDLPEPAIPRLADHLL